MEIFDQKKLEKILIFGDWRKSDQFEGGIGPGLLVRVVRTKKNPDPDLEFDFDPENPDTAPSL